MKTIYLAAALTLAALPAFAQEGGRDPFPFRNPGVTTYTTGRQYVDVGQAQYPNVVGRPGTVLALSGEGVLQANANEAPVQTANSLPAGFVAGTTAFAGLPTRTTLTASR